MNCTDIADLLPDYLRRRLPAAEEQAIRGHLATCPACAAAYEEELAFEHMLHGTDAPTPAYLLPQIMASVRVQPQHKPAFRLRPLDIVFALAAACALYGMFVAANALGAIVPFIIDTLDLRSFFSGATGLILLLTVACTVIGVGVSVAVAAVMNGTVSRSREPYTSPQG
jgi:predicted anti-sigma-YlaC factor YlaD